jgi:hypothetical protein
MSDTPPLTRMHRPPLAEGVSPAEVIRMAERDGCGCGCGCPPFVLRCAHWEGRILVLGETGYHGLPACTLEPSGNFGVWVGERFIAHNCGQPGHVALPVISDWGHGFPYHRLNAAEAEFSRRERQMLEREDA